MMTQAERWIFRVLLAGYLTLATWMLLAPMDGDSGIHINDKLVHGLVFLAMAGLADFAFPGVGYRWPKWLPILCYGFAIEILQGRLPYRSFEWADLLADAVGVFAYPLLVPLGRRMPWLRRRWREV